MADLLKWGDRVDAILVEVPPELHDRISPGELFTVGGNPQIYMAVVPGAGGVPLYSLKPALDS